MFVHAQIFGGLELSSLPEVFSWIQHATLFDTGSQLRFERNGDKAAFIAASGGSSSSHWGPPGRGGRGSRGKHDS